MTTLSPELLAEQAEKIQGWVATITHKGKRRFCKFGGGLTKDYMQAEFRQTEREAWETARRFGKSIYDLPGAVAVNGLCELIESTSRHI